MVIAPFILLAAILGVAVIILVRIDMRAVARLLLGGLFVFAGAVAVLLSGDRVAKAAGGYLIVAGLAVAVVGLARDWWRQRAQMSVVK